MQEFNVISAAELMKDYAPLPCPTNAPPLTLSQIISIEPRIAEILKTLKPSRSPKRYRQYFEVKSKLGKLVGWQAEQFDLRTSQAYDVIMDVVIEKLLEACKKDNEAAIRADVKAISKIEAFSAEYHSAGRAIKNMARMAVGKEPIGSPTGCAELLITDKPTTMT